MAARWLCRCLLRIGVLESSSKLIQKAEFGGENLEYERYCLDLPHNLRWRRRRRASLAAFNAFLRRPAAHEHGEEAALDAGDYGRTAAVHAPHTAPPAYRGREAREGAPIGAHCAARRQGHSLHHPATIGAAQVVTSRAISRRVAAPRRRSNSAGASQPRMRAPCMMFEAKVCSREAQWCDHTLGGGGSAFSTVRRREVGCAVHVIGRMEGNWDVAHGAARLN
ncbi:hypothetical protein B0H11DRAFT_1899467 [Mycena galericulata]|nr:hypothetical protein B0H11DRAFT_1899467 [Mycena galericulata]